MVIMRVKRLERQLYTANMSDVDVPYAKKGSFESDIQIEITRRCDLLLGGHRAIGSPTTDRQNTSAPLTLMLFTEDSAYSGRRPPLN